MTIRPRAARSLRDLRTRLRDLAAATHAGTLAARDRSAQELADEQQALENHFDTAQHQMLEARSIYALQQVEEDTGVHRIAIADASKKLADDTRQTTISEAALKERAKQLKSTEALVERLEDALKSKVAIAEQRAYDDMASGPRRR